MAEVLEAVALFGRQQQIDTMRLWVSQLAAGQGRAALIEGEPGIGKSSLLRVGAKEALAAGCQVFWASCDELSQAFPLLPLLDPLDARAANGAGRPGIAEMLRSAVAPGNRVDVVAAATERLLAIIDERCAAMPVLLIVDDLHWADPATVATLGRLAKTVRQLPLLLIATTRPVPRRDDVGVLRRVLEPEDLLTLDHLTEPEIVDFVATRVGGVPGPRLMRQARGASGNPLYLTELLDALIRGRGLTTVDGQVEVTGGRTPGSLAAAIADRLEFLSPPVRGLLRGAALLGGHFSVSELSVVSDQRVSDLLPILDEAILAGVLLEDGDELAFRHPLIRAALYDGLPTAVRNAWHRDAARALADSGAAPERVAQQLRPTLDALDGSSRADDWAVRWLVESAQQLVAHAPDVAIPLLRWAVVGAPAGEPPYDLLNSRLADALYRVGDPVAAAEVANAALVQATVPDNVVDLHWTLTQCRAIDGRSEESLAALERALTSPRLAAGDRARLLVLTARTHRSLGHVEAATEAAEAALVEATAVNDRWATGWALGLLTIIAVMRGQHAKALPLFERALTVSDGDPALADLRLMLQINQAVALGDLDRHGDAIKAAEQVRRLADDAGNAIRLAQAQSVLGELLFDVGRWDDALTEVDMVAGTTSDPGVECSDHGVAATIQLHRGESGAHCHLDAAERFVARLGDRMPGSLTLARSLNREQAGGPAEALAVLIDGLADNKELEETADLLADAVRLAVTVGDQTAARTVTQRAEALARTSDVPHRQAVAPHCVGLLEQNPVHLLRAAELYHAAGRPLPRAQALEAAGVALADGGDLTGARAHFTNAFSVYAELGAEWDLARTQARFRAYGIRRGPHVRHRRAHQGWDSLTPTERRVVVLVAQGLSNPQIAGQLFLSRRTVQTHVSHILAKLGLNSRIDIAREASRRVPTAEAS